MMKNLIASGMTVIVMMFPAFSYGKDAEQTNDEAAGEQVIKPAIDRRDIIVPRIDTEDFEVGVYYGVLSIEDFGSNSVQGLRAAYHVTESIFFEGFYGQSKIVDRNLGVPQFPNEEEDLIYYNISLGYNFFPGEVFLSDDTALTSAVYLLAGVGNTVFIDEDHNTFNFGLGFRILGTDWLAFHMDMQDRIFDSDILGKNKTTHNFELNFGFSVFF